MNAQRWLFYGGIFATAAVVTGALLRIDPGHWPWLLSRSSGIAAFVLLTGSMAFGLVISSRAGIWRVPRAALFEMHRFISVLAMVAIFVHAGVLLFDTYAPFAPAELLVPFAATFKRTWTAFGVISMWVMAVVVASSWMRNRISQKWWRRIHMSSFAAYLASLWHGLMAGTDASNPAVYWLYAASAALVAGLLAWRLMLRADDVTPARPAARRTASVSHGAATETAATSRSSRPAPGR